MSKNKCECNRNANVESVKKGRWYCWTCFSYLEEDQSVGKQDPPIRED